MPRTHRGPSVDDEEPYETLRDQSKRKSARFADSSRRNVGRRGGSGPAHDDWTVDCLSRRAADPNISRHSTMAKPQLADALRDH